MVKKNFISQSQPEGGQSRPRARNWIIDEDNYLLGILKEIVLKGKNNGGHFTTEQWQNVTDEYKERTGQNDRGKLQMQNRYKILKKQYSLNYKLRNKSGWGWDEGKNMVIAPTAKDWEALIKENDEYLRIKNKAFPQFDDMNFLCGGNTSKGRWWFGTTDDFNEREGSTSLENELEDTDGPHNNEIDLSDSEEVQEVEETQVPFNGTQPPPQPIPSSTPIIKHHAQPSGLKRASVSSSVFSLLALSSRELSSSWTFETPSSFWFCAFSNFRLLETFPSSVASAMDSEFLATTHVLD
ncbi:uncharacterized protein LOC109836997 [Asparagus officinalis]|uniref:uncharacterized protein LOC109836997 n=1 Tax=Asparagus officinalis TaxID=4686 RepID=UPI00098E1FAE|nr:uncharacterized protein LOC109836997 [Asparagus officinalis]